MKILSTLSFTVAMLTGLALSGQSFQTSAYFESTHIGPKLGTTVGYAFDSRIEVGGFYQNATGDVPQREDGYKINEEEFYGAYFNYPVAGNETVNLKFNVRTGVTNGENFIITPSLLASYQPFKILSVGTGAGVRNFRPTLQASVRINL